MTIKFLPTCQDCYFANCIEQKLKHYTDKLDPSYCSMKAFLLVPGMLASACL